MWSFYIFTLQKCLLLKLKVTKWTPLHDKRHKFICTISTFAQHKLALLSRQVIKECFLCFCTEKCYFSTRTVCNSDISGPEKFHFVCVKVCSSYVAITAGCSSHNVWELARAWPKDCPWKTFICGVYVKFALFVWKIQQIWKPVYISSRFFFNNTV